MDSISQNIKAGRPSQVQLCDLARTSKSGGPLKSSCVTLNEPHNLSEYQFILNHTDVTVSAPTRGQVPLRVR